MPFFLIELKNSLLRVIVFPNPILSKTLTTSLLPAKWKRAAFLSHGVFRLIA
jgi:hypothetical protein